MRIKIILPILAALTIAFLWYSQQENHVLSIKRNILQKAFEEPLYLNLDDSSRSVTFEDMGISYNKVKDEVEVNAFKLDEYITSLEKEYEFISKNTIISFEDFTFRAPSSKAKIKIDRTPFSSEEAIIDLATSSPRKVKLTMGTMDDPKMQRAKTDEILETITTPLLIKYGRNPVYISKDTLKEFIFIEEADGSVYGRVDFDKVSEYLDELHAKYRSSELVVIHNQAVDSIRRALLYRAASEKVNNAVILPLEGKPKSDGSLHDVYLEVIKSQQRLYRFEYGKLVKTYVVSTGLTWETPAGNHQILGKQKMTISYFGNWFMPDYLPIGYVNGSYRFGFHAIPYHMDGNGNIFSRDPNTMGSPATGGCIQLLREEATELFEWAVVGTPVYVYE